MIGESYFWRRELKLLLGEIDVWGKELAMNDDSDEAAFRLERCLFLSAFATRKLIESEKVPDSVASRSLRCETFPAIEKVSRRLSVYSFDNLYDFHSPKEVQLPLRQVCNELIHSRLLANCVGDHGELAGFLVASDRNVDERMIMIPIEEWCSAITLVSEKSITAIHKSYDPRSGKVVTKLD